MKKTHTGLKIFLMVIIMIIFIALVIFGFFYLKKEKIEEEKIFDAFISSYDYEVMLYNEDYTEAIKVIRGSSVKLYENLVERVFEDSEKESVIYRKIEYDGNIYLINPDDVCDKYEDSVKQKEVYVRTSITTYKDSESSNIYGFIKKGEKLDVVGFDKINKDGSVNMYKIKIENTNDEIDASDENDVYVYAYAKYIVDTLEEATAVYNENGTYDIHKDRRYSFELYGGYASNLDYYPYEKPSFENNVFVDQAKTYYLVGTKYILGDVDRYITLAKNAGADAFVVDIKDGALAYQSEVSKEYSITSYNTAMNSVDFYKQAIDKIKASGLYVIGRIVLFNDSQYAKDNPGECILSVYGENTGWVSAYSRRAWEYNVKLAREAVSLFGFNEIQFDYVRFPEASYRWSKYNYNFNNTYNEEKAQAVQNFLYYATDQIHKDNVYLSVDVFGESSSEYVTAYGQYWPAISNIVDAISAMPYTDHFDRNNSAYWTNPYQTLKNWGLTAATRQKEIPTPAKVRTWITAYDTPYWNVTTVYGSNEIAAQVKGLVDAGLGHGFITWNANSSYNKYATIAPAFSREY